MQAGAFQSTADADNLKARLALAGLDSVEVRVALAGIRTLVVPNNVLLFRAEGTRVAAVENLDQHFAAMKHDAHDRLGSLFDEAAAKGTALSSAEPMSSNPCLVKCEMRPGFAPCSSTARRTAGESVWVASGS